MPTNQWPCSTAACLIRPCTWAAPPASARGSPSKSRSAQCCAGGITSERPKGLLPHLCVRACAGQGQRSAHPPPGLCHGSSAGADPGQRKKGPYARHVSGRAVLTVLPLAYLTARHVKAPANDAHHGNACVQCWQCCHSQYSMPGTSRAPRAAHAPIPDMRARNWRIEMQQPCVPTATYLAGGFHGAPLAYPRTPMRWRHACRRPWAGALSESSSMEAYLETPQNRLPAHPYPSASQGACKVHNEFGCMRAGAHACAAGDGDALRWASPAAQACAPAAPSTF